MKKSVIKTFAIIFAIFLMIGITNIYATVGGPFDPSILNSTDNTITTPSSRISTPLYRLFSTIMFILQIAALTGIVYCGVRYMFLGADGKAGIKKDLTKVVIGCIIAFGASTITKAIITITEDALN